MMGNLKGLVVLLRAVHVRRRIPTELLKSHLSLAFTHKVGNKGVVMNGGKLKNKMKRLMTDKLGPLVPS